MSQTIWHSMAPTSTGRAVTRCWSMYGHVAKAGMLPGRFWYPQKRCSASCWDARQASGSARAELWLWPRELPALEQHLTKRPARGGLSAGQATASAVRAAEGAFAPAELGVRTGAPGTSTLADRNRFHVKNLLRDSCSGSIGLIPCMCYCYGIFPKNTQYMCRPEYVPTLC